MLSWLTFAEIDDRRAQVKDAHKKTFKWIFRDNHKTGFARWLRSGDGIYWIGGKPASGKSTLMKFITDEPRLQRLLQEWTGATPTVISSFWFWAAGTPLQRSLIGLYRTLLVQMMKTNDDLYRVAFPHWQRQFSRVEPTMEMLTVAMNNLLASKALTTNFFFIIDGLDEYDRDSVGKAELAELMLNMTKYSRVKCLLSSRLETPFKVAFRQSPQLRLEMLTKPDILAYVETKLWSNPLLRDISAAEEHSISEIGLYIVDHAEGVFLWVALVMNIALTAINEYDDPQAIRKRITELPPELNDLFTHILKKRIPRHHRQEAFKCLLIVLRFEPQESTEIMNDVLLSAALQASTYAKACEIARCVYEACEHQEDAISKMNTARDKLPHLLASRCQGLLECTRNRQSADLSITFCHRTLFEYLSKEEGAKRLLESAMGTSLDVDTAIMVGLIHKTWMCHMTTGKSSEASESDLRITKMFYRFNLSAERRSGQHRGDLIEAFDRLVANPFTGFVERLIDRQSIANGTTDLRPEDSVLAFALTRGSTLYLKAVISRFHELGTERSSFLLCFASSPDVVSRREVESWRRECATPTAYKVEPTYRKIRNEITRSHINLETCTMLLRHGADPIFRFAGETSRRAQWRPWNLVLQRTATSGHLHIRKEQIVRDLRLLLLFAQYAPDLQKCRAATEVWGGVFTVRWVNYEAMSELFLSGTCCSSRARDCHCKEAQVLRSIISETTRLLRTSDPLPTKRFSLKRWLPFLRKYRKVVLWLA